MQHINSLPAKYMEKWRIENGELRMGGRKFEKVVARLSETGATTRVAPTTHTRRVETGHPGCVGIRPASFPIKDSQDSAEAALVPAPVSLEG